MPVGHLERLVEDGNALDGSSSAVVVHGGTTWVRLKCTNGHSPRCLQAAANSAIGAAAGPEALNGTRGSRVAGSRTSSSAQKTPEPAHLADRRVA